MINKRLLLLAPESLKYIYFNVTLQVIGLLCNVLFLQLIVNETHSVTLLVLLILTRMTVHFLAIWMSHLSNEKVKIELREILFNKVLSLGGQRSNVLSDSEIIQLSGEGIEHLELYFSNYIPQFFYSMIAPIILFAFVMVNQIWVAVVLLVCVPLIPIAIVFVQKFAKKLLHKYWGIYTGLQDTFLDSLQGLLTLKLFKYDDEKQKEIEQESETFRKVTMSVLMMQLNSISVMDLIAYGGAMVAMLVAVKSNLEISKFLFIILICAEFFIPMRLLGSYFHVAMNGASAADKIFKIIDHEHIVHEIIQPSEIDQGYEIKNFSFSYEKEVLTNISLDLPMNTFKAIVGISGSGKSTLVNAMMRYIDADGIQFGNIPLKHVDIHNFVTYVSHDAMIFRGTLREVLLNGSDEAMRQALRSVSLDFNLDYEIDYLGSNLSGGERQRIALARALLKDSPFYIFDEITAAVDYESESVILNTIQQLRLKGKGVLMISHRLSNLFQCDEIYVLKNGLLIEKGTHLELMNEEKHYFDLVISQREFEVTT